MSKKTINFALSQECAFISNFFGSVSLMLEIENVGNFLLTQAEQNGSHAIYAWAVFLHLFVNWFPTTIYQKSCSEFRSRFFFIINYFRLRNEITIKIKMA